MLLTLHTALEAGHSITIEKNVQGRDVTPLGAFAHGTQLTFCARIPRTMGIAAVVMRIAPDGSEPTDLPFVFSGREADVDLYTLQLSTATLCGEAVSGLFFYEYLFLRGFDTLFSDSINNLDFCLASHSANRFRLLVYTEDFQTPEWFHGGTMYHIFPDRFCRGTGEASLHGRGRLDPDWEHGVPQYAQHAGDPVENNIFFGGNLWGVAEKLDYLQSLGVSVIYLSPIFEAASNHRYDTANYEKVDSLLGSDAAFENLIRQAHARGIRIILDGVFNHTGDDSIYFNRRGTYATTGAYQSKKSPYAAWYRFQKFPSSYEAWWGIEIMPRLNHENPTCRRYFTGEAGIAAKWLDAGIDGWRLDVADELSDSFLDELNATVKKKSDNEAILIGEVWENAVDKIAYGRRRKYLHGKQLDSVMNYPFRNAVLDFLTAGDAGSFYHILTELYATYPPTVSHSLMNLLGTHDTERILSLLGDGGAGRDLENPALAKLRLTPAQRKKAISLLKIASALQFTVYGVPSIYYGDEAGLEGYHDPFCRMPFPWGREDPVLLEHYRKLGKLRQEHPALRNGSFAFLAHTDSAFAYERHDPETDDRILVAANMGKTAWELPLHGVWKNAMTNRTLKSVTVPSQGFVILKK